MTACMCCPRTTKSNRTAVEIVVCSLHTTAHAVYLTTILSLQHCYSSLTSCCLRVSCVAITLTLQRSCKKIEGNVSTLPLKKICPSMYGELYCVLAQML